MGTPSSPARPVASSAIVPHTEARRNSYSLCSPRNCSITAAFRALCWCPQSCIQNSVAGIANPALRGLSSTLDDSLSKRSYDTITALCHVGSTAEDLKNTLLTLNEFSESSTAAVELLDESIDFLEEKLLYLPTSVGQMKQLYDVLIQENAKKSSAEIREFLEATPPYSEDSGDDEITVFTEEEQVSPLSAILRNADKALYLQILNTYPDERELPLTLQERDSLTKLQANLSPRATEEAGSGAGLVHKVEHKLRTEVVKKGKGEVENLISSVTSTLPATHPLLQLEEIAQQLIDNSADGNFPSTEQLKLMQKTLASIEDRKNDPVYLSTTFNVSAKEIGKIGKEITIFSLAIEEILRRLEEKTPLIPEEKCAFTTLFSDIGAFVQTLAENHNGYGILQKGLLKAMRTGKQSLQQFAGSFGSGNTMQSAAAAEESPAAPASKHPLHILLHTIDKSFQTVSDEEERHIELLDAIENAKVFDEFIEERLISELEVRTSARPGEGKQLISSSKPLLLSCLKKALLIPGEVSSDLSLEEVIERRIGEDDRSIDTRESDPTGLSSASLASPRSTGDTPFLCGGIFETALSALQGSLSSITTAGVDAIAEQIEYHLENTVASYIANYDDIDARERTTILKELKNASSVIAKARKSGTLDAFQTILTEIKDKLSRHSILVNGISALSSSGKSERSETISQSEEDAILDRVKGSPVTAVAREPSLDESKKLVSNEADLFHDSLSMYVTHMYIFEILVGKEDKESKIRSEIEREIEADSAFVALHPPGSREYKRRFDDRFSERLSEVSGSDEQDLILKEVMLSSLEKTQSLKTGAARIDVSLEPRIELSQDLFKAAIRRQIDSRNDLSWPYKQFVKYIALPFSLSIVSYMLEKTINNARWTLQKFITKMAQGNESARTSLISPSAVDAITNFIRKYITGLSEWAHEGNLSRDSFMSEYFDLKKVNGGFEKNELYSELSAELIDIFYTADKSSYATERAFTASWSFATTPPFSWDSIPSSIANILLWPVKGTLGIAASALTGALHGAVRGFQTVGNKLSKMILKKVVANINIGEKITNSITGILHGNPYTNTLNRVVGKLLKEAWEKLQDMSRLNEAEKMLQRIPRILDNPIHPKAKAIDLLEKAWSSIQQKMEDKMELVSISSTIERLKNLLNREDGMPDGIDLTTFDGEVKSIVSKLWAIHDNPEDSQSEDFPEPTKQAVSGLIQNCIVLLDKFQHQDPERLKEGGLSDSFQKTLRSFFLDQTVESISSLLLACGSTLLDEDLLTKQVHTGLKTVNNILLDVDDEDPTDSSDADAEQDIKKYLDLIKNHAIDTALSNASDTILSAKTKAAKETIDWLKVTLSDMPAIHENKKIKQKNIPSRWKSLFDEYMTKGEIEPLGQIHDELIRLLKDFSEKKIAINKADAGTTPQMKEELNIARDNALRSIDAFSKIFSSIKEKARAKNEATQCAETVRHTLEALTTCTEDMSEFPLERLKGISAQLQSVSETINLIKKSTSHAAVIDEASAQTKVIQDYVHELIVFKEESADITGFKRDLVAFKEEKREAIVSMRDAVGPERITVRMTGANAKATERVKKLKAILEGIGKKYGEYVKELFIPRLEALNSAETIDVFEIEFSAFETSLSEFELTRNAALSDKKSEFDETASPILTSLERYSATLHHAAGEGKTELRELIRNAKEQLDICTAEITSLGYPPVINFNLIDTSPKSALSQWSRTFILAEIDKRAGQAINLIRNKSAFKGALNTTALEVLGALNNQKLRQKKHQ